MCAFDEVHIVVCSGKGDKDRITVIGDVMNSRISSGSMANHTGLRTLGSPLKHCDSVQRATTGHNRAAWGNAPGFSAAMRFALKGRHKTASPHAQVKWHNARIHNQGSDVPCRRKPGERSGVSPPSQMRATRWADTHRSPSELGAAFIRLRGFSCPPG